MYSIILKRWLHSVIYSQVQRENISTELKSTMFWEYLMILNGSMILWGINSCTKCKFLLDFYDHPVVFLFDCPTSSQTQSLFCIAFCSKINAKHASIHLYFLVHLYVFVLETVKLKSHWLECLLQFSEVCNVRTLVWWSFLQVFFFREMQLCSFNIFVKENLSNVSA